MLRISDGSRDTQVDIHSKIAASSSFLKPLQVFFPPMAKTVDQKRVRTARSRGNGLMNLNAGRALRPSRTRWSGGASLGIALTPRYAGGGPVLVEFVCKLGILKMPPAREIASGKENNRGARTA